MKRRVLNPEPSILGKRPFTESPLDQRLSQKPRTQAQYPIGYGLDLTLQLCVQSRQFLERWVESTPLEKIFRYVPYANVGFYGALNCSNYFWYLGKKYEPAFTSKISLTCLLVTIKKLREGYDPIINFRDAALAGCQQD